MRRAAFALAVLASVAVTLTTAGITSAGQTTMCTTTLGPIMVGNLAVPAGAVCVLDGTRVAGNVTVQSGNGTVESGGVLTTTTASVGVGPTINGNVIVEADGIAVLRVSALVKGNYQCNQCSYADLHGATVKGNFQDNGMLEGAFLDGGTIGGNLEIVNSFGGTFGFSVSGFSVGGNLLFEGNLGEPSSVISTNTIKGNLRCDGNTPPPTGAGNSAKQKLGQCATLLTNPEPLEGPAS